MLRRDSPLSICSLHRSRLLQYLIGQTVATWTRQMQDDVLHSASPTLRGCLMPVPHYRITEMTGHDFRLVLKELPRWSCGVWCGKSNLNRPNLLRIQSWPPWFKIVNMPLAQCTNQHPVMWVTQTVWSKKKQQHNLDIAHEKNTCVLALIWSHVCSWEILLDRIRTMDQNSWA